MDKTNKANHGVELKSSNDIGNCVVCREKTLNKCQRCEDPYCSEFCQRRDWQSHRYICFPMPKLINAGECTSSKEVTAKEEKEPEKVLKVTSSVSPSMPPTGSCVILTGIRSSNGYYIRSTNPSVVAENRKVLNSINDFGKQSSPLNAIPKPNSYAVSLLREKWCRVTILNNSTRRGPKVLVLFVDYGTVSMRLPKDLRKITPELANLPCFTYMVQLEGIKKNSTDSKLLHSLEEYTNKEYKVEFAAGSNVKLYQWGSNVLINPLIAATISKHEDNERNSKNTSASPSAQNGNGIQQKMNGFEKSSAEKSSNEKDSEKSDLRNKVEIKHSDNVSVASLSNTKCNVVPRQIQIQKPCLQPPFKTISLNENDGESKIIILDDSYIENGYVGCILEKYLENLNAVTKFLHEYEVTDQPYKPRFEEYCLAEFDKEWYRSKVVEVVSEDTFAVTYIDFTNEKELTSKSIRRYPMSLTLPCYSTICRISGLPDDISKELKHFLNTNCTVSTHLHINNVRMVDNTPHIESKELLTKISKLKLL